MLEIGGGLGVLSEHLAERVGHVHVVEIDERLREALGDATDPHANVSVHWGDAMRLDLAAFRPVADEARREPALRDRGGADAAHDRGAPGDERWVAMVQREVGERLAATPGTLRLRGDLGAGPARVRGAGCCGRSRAACSIRFRMSTRCCCCSCVTSGAAATPRAARARARRVRPPAQGARRLAGAGAGRAGRGRVSGCARRWSSRPPADVRAERLAPEEFRALGRLLGV